MIKKFVKNYYKLFDEKIQNGSIMVLIIAFLITSVGNVAHASGKDKIENSYLKANILEINNNLDYIKINGKTYKLID